VCVLTKLKNNNFVVTFLQPNLFGIFFSQNILTNSYQEYCLRKYNKQICILLFRTFVRIFLEQFCKCASRGLHKAGFQKNTWQQHNFKSVCVETSFMYRPLDAHSQNLLQYILAKYKKRLFQKKSKFITEDQFTKHRNITTR
jgi:hypothetical protein